MTNRDPIPPGVVLVALDIAKLRNEVLIEMPGQQRRRRLSALNNRAEHDRLPEEAILRVMTDGNGVG